MRLENLSQPFHTGIAYTSAYNRGCIHTPATARVPRQFNGVQRGWLPIPIYSGEFVLFLAEVARLLQFFDNFAHWLFLLFCSFHFHWLFLLRFLCFLYVNVQPAYCKSQFKHVQVLTHDGLLLAQQVV